MKKLILKILFIFVFIIIPTTSINATSGACSWHGGVNCSAGADWDGSVICYDGWRDSSVSYYSMVKCNSYYSTPSCPLHSTYNSLSGTCKCNYGYVANSQGNGCISEDDYCENLYGFNSKYDSLYDKCECDYGYIFGKNILGDIECIYGNTYCHNLYGYNSSFDSLSKECECDYGYSFVGDECVKNNNNYNYNSTINYESLLKSLEGNNQQLSCPTNSTLTSGQCICNIGFVMKNNQCISNTEDCKLAYGSYVFGVSDNKGGSNCYCLAGYKWNENQTACIEIPTTNNTEYNSEEQINNFIDKEKNEIKNVDSKLASRLKGKILLQIESHGEAWYINPKNEKKYYMANGNEAYKIMRYLGVGITNKDLEKIKNDKIFAKNNSGKIFLQVEANGEAYYIDFNGNAHYLKDGSDAYTIMRELGLGITNNDIRKINIEEINK